MGRNEITAIAKRVAEIFDPFAPAFPTTTQQYAWIVVVNRIIRLKEMTIEPDDVIELAKDSRQAFDTTVGTRSSLDWEDLPPIVRDGWVAVVKHVLTALTEQADHLQVS